MEHLTTLSKAMRVVDQFILDSTRKEHRVINEDLEVTPEDYRILWDHVYETRSMIFQTDLRERDVHGEDSLKLFYTARNHKYSLLIKKAKLAKAA